MNNKKTVLTVILACFVLTFFVALWLNSFALPLSLCVLQVLSCFWLVSLFDFKWDKVDITHNPWFVVCFGFGTVVTVVGVFMLLLPLIGFTLFNAFYTVGTICTLGSILLLMESLNIIEKVKGQVETFMKDPSRWETWIKLSNSDIGIAVEGVCVLLFPTLGALLIVVQIVGPFEQGEEEYTEQEGHGPHDRPEGHRAQGEHGGNGVLGAISGFFGGLFGGLIGGAMGALSSLTSAVGGLAQSAGNLARGFNSSPGGSQMQNKPRNENKMNERVKKTGQEKTKGKKQSMDKNKKLEAIIKRKFMKALRWLILGVVLWNWGLALLLWILRILFALLVKLLQCCPQNIVWFIVCFTLGAACTLLGIYMLFLPGLGFSLFKLFYTVGNVCLLGSTLSLMGPKEQLEMMFDDTRKVATSLMLTCLGLTLLAAFWWESPFLALMFSILHILSSIWYCLSYIACAREQFKKITSFFI